MEITDIQTGDGFLTTTYNNFVSKAIVYVMKKWAKKKGIQAPIVLSHAAGFAWIAGELYVYGSIDSGYKPWIFNKHYSLTDSNEGVVVMRRKIALTDAEKNQTINYMQHLTTVSFMYQYWNLLKWLILVYLNINLFRPDSEKTTYCYESELMRRKNLNPDKYGETYQADFFMLIDDPNYEIIYKNLK